MAQIVLNPGYLLKTAANRQGCRTNIGGLRVQAAESGKGVVKTIPDIVVACGSWSPERTFTTDPTVVVDVLSPSTMDYDRGAKPEFYKTLTSLQDIVIVYQDEIRLGHCRRNAQAWDMVPLSRLGQTLNLAGLSMLAALAETYAGTGLDG